MVENEEIELIKGVGEKIRLRRLELNLSQEILSYDANIPRNQIGRIERGEISTTISTLYKICKWLGHADFKTTQIYAQFAPVYDQDISSFTFQKIVSLDEHAIFCMCLTQRRMMWRHVIDVQRMNASVVLSDTSQYHALVSNPLTIY